MTDPIAEWNAQQSAFYAQVAAKHGTPRPDAGPEWGDLTPAEQAAEIALGEDSIWSETIFAEIARLDLENERGLEKRWAQQDGCDE